jgi:hypothetical protein
VEIENKVVASFTGNKLFNYQQETVPPAMKEFYWHTLNVVLRNVLMPKETATGYFSLSCF